MRTRNVGGRREIAGTIGGLTLASLLCAMPAYAQDAPSAQPSATTEKDAPAFSDDIVVTANKRGAENIQNIPYNISAIGTEALAKTAAVDLNDIARLVPGVTVSGDAGNKNIVIRGLAGSGEVPQVALYLDETLIPSVGGTNVRQPDIGLFDLERVEVLRGPQGTLYGGGAQAGTIRYITNKPDLASIEAAINGRLGVRSRDAGTRAQIDGMLNLPVVTDMLALRVVGYARNTGGFVDLPALGLKNTGDEETRGVRGEILFKPTSTTRILLSGTYQKLTLDNTSAVRPDSDTRTPPILEPYRDTVKIGSLTIDQDVGFGTITGSLSRFVRDTYFSYDQSAIVSVFAGPGTLASITQPGQASSTVGELRFASKFSGPFDILAGLFYDRRILDSHTLGYFDDASTGLPNLSRGVFFDSIDQSRVRNKAAFVNGTLHLTSTLTLEAGIRFYELQREKDNILVKGFFPGQVPGTAPTTVSKSTGNVKKAELSWQATPDILTYALYSEGFREGGPNTPLLPRGFFNTYDPDKVQNYEVGAKMTLFDRQLVLNPALYYMSWNDIQVSQLYLGAFPFIANAGKADLKGVEIEGRVRPKALEGFSVNFSARYSEQKLTEDAVGPQFTDPGRKGDALPYSTTFGANIGVEQAFDVGGLSAYVRADATYTGPAYTTLSPINPLRRRLGDYALVNAQLGIDQPTWRAALYTSNLFNRRGFTTWRVESFQTEDRVITTQPREIGIEVGFKF